MDSCLQMKIMPSFNVKRFTSKLKNELRRWKIMAKGRKNKIEFCFGKDELNQLLLEMGCVKKSLESFMD